MGSWDDDAYGYYGIIAFTAEIFKNDSWPVEFMDTINGETCYVIRGLRWMFNPFPAKIYNACARVLDLFVGASYWAMNIINDSSKPYLENSSVVLLDNGLVEIIVKAIDMESGIHYIVAHIGTIDKYFIYDRTLDAWVLTFDPSLTQQIDIEVYNRAGLSTTTTISIPHL